MNSEEDCRRGGAGQRLGRPMTELVVERDRRVETWTLNRPHARNALDANLVDLLKVAMASAESSNVEIVVLRGAGPSFCAGADLSMLSGYDPSCGATPRGHLRNIWDLTLAMERSPVTFVAALHGHAIAGGLELALACDVVLAAAGTLVGDGHVRHGLMPGGGASARMDRAFGAPMATWLALSGQLMPVEDAAFATWLRSVTAPEDLDEAIEACLDDLQSAESVARSAYKQLLYETRGAIGEAERDRELDAFDRHWLANDVPRTLRAFLTKNREAS